MRLVQILDHEVERHFGVIGGRSRHEDEVGAAPKLEHGDVIVPLDLAHAETLPVVRRPVDISDGQHRVSDPYRRPSIHDLHSYSTPRIAVLADENQPPVPFTHASWASATCRPAASPRSCRTASTSRKMPRIPGWHAERPPPSVFVGSDPSTRMVPPSTNGPPSPFLQKP